MRLLALLAAALVLPVVAHAEPAPDSPFVVVVGTGAGTAKIGDIPTGAIFYSYGERTTVAALMVDVGYRVERRVMLGLHAGAVSGVKFIDGWSDFMGTSESTHSVRAIQYGVTAQFAVHERVWLAPWLGVQDSMQRKECYYREVPAFPQPMITNSCDPEPWDYHRETSFAWGLTLGGDAFISGDHRLSVIAALAHSTVAPVPGAPTAEGDYTSVWLGLAYRFWR